MKKKILSLALALALCLGLAVPVFATETWTMIVDSITITANPNGTLNYTGTGMFTKEHMNNGLEMILVVTEAKVKTVTINVGANITYDGNWSAEMKEALSSFGVDATISNSTPAESLTVGGFADVKENDYFATPVAWAVNKTITAGTSATTFSPNQNCTVAQILSFLYRAYGSPKVSGSNPFSDVKSSDYYYSAALWAAEKGMVTGSTFGGDRPCTRAMAVTYMWKAAGSPFATNAYTDFAINKNGALNKYHGSGGDVVIPNGVKNIDIDTFRNSKTLTNVVIPSSVTWIGGAFSSCENLKAVTMHNGVTHIGMYAFEYCKNLTSVTIPSSVTTIDTRAFGGCDSLTDVYYEGSEAQWKVINIDIDNDVLSKAAIHYNSKIPQQTQPSVNIGFTDVSATADYATAVAWAVEKGVTSGTTATTFSPDSICTRGQIVTFLHRALA